MGRQSSLPNRIARAILLLGVLQYVVLVGLAMAYYPGGHEWDEAVPGYSFWRNSSSDLGRPEAWNGRDNTVSSRLYTIALLGVIISLAPLWLIVPAIIPNLRIVGRIVQAMGFASMVGMVGVGVAPSGSHPHMHMVMIGLAAVPVIPAVVLLTVGMFIDRACPRRLPIASTITLVPILIHFAQYIHHFWLGGPWTPGCVIAQRFMTAAVLAWLALISISKVEARRSKSDATPQCCSEPRL